MGYGIWTAVKSQICCATRNAIGQNFQECCLSITVGNSAPIPAQNVQLFLPTRCGLFSRLSRHLARRVSLSPSRVYLSLSRPSLSLPSVSLVSVLAIVCCGRCDLEIQSTSNIKRQPSTTTNKQLHHRTQDQFNSPNVCVYIYSSYCGARSNQSVHLHPSQEIAESLRSSNQRCNLIQLIHSFCLFFFRFSPQ